MISSNDRFFNATLLLLYIAVSFIAVLFHEPYTDEAQAWLITRDLGIKDIFQQLSIKGHPGLWYLLLLPFAKAGAPYSIMFILHWLISVTAVALFIMNSPFNKWFKALFVFSFYMLYEYTVMARNYNLPILLLFMAATHYSKRFTQPYVYASIIFLLFNSNLYAFGAAAGLLCIFVLDGILQQKNAPTNKKFFAVSFAPLLIMISGGILAIIQLWPTQDLSPDITIKQGFLPAIDFNSIWIVLTGLQNAFIPVVSEYEELKVALFFLVIAVLFFVYAASKIQVFLFLFMASGWINYVFITKMPGFWRHEGMFLVFIILSLWLSVFYKTKQGSFSFVRLKYPERLKYFLQIVLCCILFVQDIFGLSTLRKELMYESSGSLSMADHIKEQCRDMEEVACYKSYTASAIAPFLPNTKLWFVDRQDYGSYFILDSLYKRYGDMLTQGQIIDRVKEKYSTGAYLLLNSELEADTSKAYSFQLLYQNKQKPWAAGREQFYLYKIIFR